MPPTTGGRKGTGEAATLSLDHGYQATVRNLALSGEHNGGVTGGGCSEIWCTKKKTKGTRGTATLCVNNKLNNYTVARTEQPDPKNIHSNRIYRFACSAAETSSAVLRSKKPSRV